MKIALQKQQNCFIPQDEYNEDLIRKLKDGDCFLANIVKQRNPKFHRKFFKAMSIAVNNIPEDFQNKTGIHTVDGLRKALMLTTGRTEKIRNMHGEIIEIPSSIAFDEMDELEFRDLVRDCEQVFLKAWGWNPFKKEEREEHEIY